jgi:hypothetical protein
MKLPMELLDEILDYIATLSLRSCSLVTKSWTSPCQKRLFKDVEIHPGNLQRWLDDISPENVELLGCVHALTYKEYVSPKSGTTGPAHHALREYLPSFRTLRHLILHSHISSLPQPLEICSAFQNTLSDITLVFCSITKCEFVALVNYFPNLMHLHLRYIKYLKEDKSIPPLSRLHFKNIRVIQLSEGGLDLIEELSRLGLQFEEVVISEWDPLRVVDAFGENAKCLRLLITRGGVYRNRCPMYLWSHYFPSI